MYTEVDDFTEYSASDRSLKLFCGDIFKFLPSAVGQFDAIWDCNALVAVNMDQRQQYADLLISLLRPKGQILMTTFEYEEKLHNRHPFCVKFDELCRLFEPHCSAKHLESVDAESFFLERHNLPWAKRPVTLLTKND